MKHNTIYIYGLICPEKQCVRYVGKTINPLNRFKGYIAPREYGNNRRLRRLNWIRSLITKGLTPIFTIPEQVNTGDWSPREVYWLDKLRKEGHTLINMAKGEAGHTGHLHTDKAKLKMSLVTKGRKSHFKGKNILKGLNCK